MELETMEIIKLVGIMLALSAMSWLTGFLAGVDWLLRRR
jgi:hypothetical protein